MENMDYAMSIIWCTFKILKIEIKKYDIFIASAVNTIQIFMNL